MKFNYFIADLGYIGLVPTIIVTKKDKPTITTNLEVYYNKFNTEFEARLFIKENLGKVKIDIVYLDEEFV